MRWLRLSITSLMIVLLILAADLAWLRWFLIQGRRSLFGLHPMGLDLGIIPMARALAMGGFLIASRRRRSRPFLVGFTTSGSVALMAYFACCLLAPQVLDRALRSLRPALNGWSERDSFVSSWRPWRPPSSATKVASTSGRSLG